MNRTRRSFYYLASYALAGGLGLMASPQFALSLLFAQRQYDDVMLRFAGVLLLSLGILVAWLIAVRAERMYPATIAVRTVICLWLLVLYRLNGDRLFLVLLGIVGAGLAFTTVSYILDRRTSAT